jgi:hypothetical protein
MPKVGLEISKLASTPPVPVIFSPPPQPVFHPAFVDAVEATMSQLQP